MRQQRKRLAKGVFYWLVAVVLGSRPGPGWSAEDIALRIGGSEGRAAEAEKDKVLTLEEAVRIALENHPSIAAAREKVGAQQAVVGQQLAAYYPTISMGNSYRTANVAGTTSSPEAAFDFFTSQATFDMTLYNFGKREGAVQSSRDTLDATGYNYKTAVDGVVLGVKQAYYSVLQANALLKVREETVKDRELLLRQAQGGREVEAILFHPSQDLVRR